MTTKCQRCHEDQPDGTKFCMSCGARLSFQTTPAAGQDAFAPTLATDLATAAGTGTPRGVEAVSVGIPPSVGTTPPSFTATPGVVLAPMPVEDRSIVIATVAGKLVGLDAQTGTVAWEHAIEPGTPQLVIHAGMVLAAVGQSVYCCEYRTGRPMWRALLTAPSSRVTMVVEPDRVYAFGAGVVDAFDLSGRKVWTRSILVGSAASGAIGLPGNVSQADRE